MRTANALTIVLVAILFGSCAIPNSGTLPYKTGLRVWLRADSGIVLRPGSDVVSLWRDMSGNGNDAIRDTMFEFSGMPGAESVPKWVPSGAISGKPCVRWDQGNPVIAGDGTKGQYPAKGDGGFIFPIQKGIRTMFFVQYRDSLAFGGHHQRYTVGYTEWGIRYNSETHPGHHCTDFIWADAPFGGASTRKGHTWLNGIPVDGVTTPMPRRPYLLSTVTAYPIRLCYVAEDRYYRLPDWQDGRSWHGDIAEILLYDHVLSDTDRHAVEAYLCTKYGIPYTPDTAGSIQSNGNAPIMRDVTPAWSALTSDADTTATPFYPKSDQWEYAYGADIRAIGSVRFSPDGSRLVTAGFDGTVRIWDAATGHLSKILHGHRGRVMYAAFSCDGRLIISAGYDKTIKTWSTKTGKLQSSHLVVPANLPWYGIQGLAVSPQNPNLAAWCARDDVSLISISDGAVLRVDNAGNQWDVAFSHDGLLLAVAQENEMETVKIFQVNGMKTPSLVHALMPGTYAYSIAWSGDDRYLAVGLVDGTVSIYDVRSGALITQLSGSSAAFCVAFSPNGKYVAIGIGEGTVRIWNWKTAEVISLSESLGDEIRALQFSPDGRQLVVAGYSDRLRMYNVESILYQD